MEIPRLSIPRIEQPPLRGTADDIINTLNAQMAWMQHHKKPEEAIRIYYGGAFGMLPAVRISAERIDFLRIVVRGEDGTLHSIVAPVSQCSFMLALVVPTASQPQEKVIFGFAEASQA